MPDIRLHPADPDDWVQQVRTIDGSHVIAEVLHPFAAQHARLIAAAPDLLAECEMASDAIASGFNSEDERMAVVARLEAAIAKAKGDAMTAEQRAALYNNGIGVPYKERP
jgi:hypothetical protein